MKQADCVVVRVYDGRDTAEQWIKEDKYALNCTRLSFKRFVYFAGKNLVSIVQRPYIELVE
ncbi:hypothetical protein LLG96_11200 [bacterium]|nr:hypothetical protein [bacterium]